MTIDDAIRPLDRNDWLENLTYDKAIKAGKEHKHALRAAQKAGQVAASLES